MGRHNGATPLRQARDRKDLSREKVAVALEPPVSAKTIERWEMPGTRVKVWRLEQLAAIYQCSVESLVDGKAAKAAA